MTNILEVFEYNQHFVAMMNVINLARLNPPKEGHKHHIIPRCWFKMNNLPIDNSKDNLVLLTYEDHVKVHKLAYLCALNSKFKGKMAYAYHRLTKGEVVANGAFAGEHNSMYGKHLSKEHRSKLSKAHKGKTTWMKGKNHSKESIKKMSESHKGKKYSKDTRKKLSEARKGRHWRIVNGHREWYK